MPSIRRSAPWAKINQIDLGSEGRSRLFNSMAGFKTHMTGSTVVGIGYGYLGATQFGMSLESCLLAGGLCSVSGMLPDLDSDSGVPLRETAMFASAVVPMMLLHRLQDLGLRRETMIAVAGVVYAFMRFVLVEVFKKYTVHRGMWHSIPAAVSVGLIAYLLLHCAEEDVRIYKSMGVFLGFMVHLVLDEIWSIEFGVTGLRFKKSFGTAMKFWGNNFLANVSVYGKLGILVYMVYHDHSFMLHQHLPEAPQFEQMAEPWMLPQSPSPQPGWR
ncbi:metal-dependent hydrolase [Rosistilla oblonga]|uniref:metal-dependent hydrolase n=1 Tax=Rosistilla oblonga TaxID=2527990 RepID=UPI001E4241D4|nr:metal-dependent hydrolase [Rosistilla oblonga]